MAKNRIIETSVQSLEFDNANFNKGTQYGQHLMEESLRKFGCGRSILIDKNNRIIAGNKTVENAGALGLEDVLIVETTGKQIVAVKRTDIDLDTKEGREMALADNATSSANLAWDADVLFAKAEEFEIVPQDWGVDIDTMDVEAIEEEDAEPSDACIIQIVCKDAQQLYSLADMIAPLVEECGAEMDTKVSS